MKLAVPIGLALTPSPGAVAQSLPTSADRQPSVFVTLGTIGGPIPSSTRSQPANVLLRGEDAYMIDAGDGAVERLTQAGVRLNRVRAVFLSHLHFDHTGGLAAILGLRYQTDTPGRLTIYGPPGTGRLVRGLVASMQPAAEAGYGLPGAARTAPEDTVHVVELAGGSIVDLPGIRITVAENTHYSFPEGSIEASRFKSLSFRFDMAERSIVYTGDTGPSRSVEALARGADILVSEMIDLDATLANVRRNSPNMPPAAFAGIRRHLTEHHLSSEQVGIMAAHADVRRVVVTHLVPGQMTRAQAARYRRNIALHFRGPVTIANDLDRF